MKPQRLSTAIFASALLFTASAHAAYDAVQYNHIVTRDDTGSLNKALTEGKFNANSRNHEGQTALYVALREPSPKVANILIERSDTDLDLANSAGETPLMMAALRGQLPQAQRLIARGARVQQTGWNALHYAASSKPKNAQDTAMLDLLLSHGAEVNSRSPNGDTPLMMAAQYSNPAAVQRLLQAGADPTLSNQQQATAANLALAKNNSNNAAIIQRWQTGQHTLAANNTVTPTSTATPLPATPARSPNTPNIPNNTDIQPALGSGSANSNIRTQWQDQ